MFQKCKSRREIARRHFGGKLGMGGLRFTTKQNREMERNGGDPVSGHVRGPGKLRARDSPRAIRGTCRSLLVPVPVPHKGRPGWSLSGHQLWMPTQATLREGVWSALAFMRAGPSSVATFTDAVKPNLLWTSGSRPQQKPSCQTPASTCLC